MAEDSGQERTEEATDKRMKEVRSKGQLQKSQDVTAWVGIAAAAAMLPMTLDRAAAAATDQVFTLTSVIASPEPARAVAALTDGMASVAATLGPLLAVVALAVVLAAAQGGVHPAKLRAHTEQFNVLTGVKRLFGMQALWNGIKALLKTAVVGAVLYLVIQSLMPVLMTAGGMPIGSLLEAAGGGAASLLQWAVAAGIGLALLDVLVIRKRNRKKTRMTKKEVRDENKNAEGDPLIKSQRRSRQLAASRNRMIAAVADADVVVVNPTHVAVALKYEPGKSAPRVVARGADHLATHIREKAAAENVPMVQDVPLARALHGACDLGQEIPVELYDAVARVLAFVMALKARGAAAGGIHTMSQPTPTPGATR
ncbi:flagellar biosynthesis protein FlhB [Georgenia sp. AZ-5]|uniref:EscU/YscU/HrcU family type III secretion system export apparatus switch protein n=1 Tax=Georgenia sp. AZ-5 TaxID=3367526 RepID=UPI00375404E2